MSGQKSYDSLRLIGRSLVPVLRELAPHVMATDDELEGLAAELVVELARQGFTVVPKDDYDSLILATRDTPTTSEATVRP